MSTNTKIEWCTHTQNFWEGCQPVGPGCDGCYAEARNKRFGGGVAINWGPGAPRRRTSESNWRKPIAWNAGHEAYFAENGRRQSVFCSSLSDWADNAVPDEWRLDAAKVMLATPNLDWLLLTKRIGNAAKMLATMFPDGVPSNIWVGATIVNQQEADRDIPKLLALPVHKLFLSMEPLLGAVNITPYMGGRTIRCGCGWRNTEHGLIGATIDHEKCGACGQKTVSGRTLDWVIVGGESGPGARPMHPDWARALRDQCQATQTPFLFKQWGEWRPMLPADFKHKGENLTLVSVDHRRAIGGHYLAHQVQSLLTEKEFQWQYPVLKVGKKLAGRELDNQIWDGYPV